MRLLLFIIALMVTFPSVPYAADFEQIKTLNCTYDTVSITNIREGKFVPSIQKENFSLMIDAIDRNGAKARILGNVGAEDVAAIAGAGILTFIEVTRAGNVNATSVYAQRDSNGNYLSSHSRHVQVGGNDGAVPSQYYGKCKELLN